MKGYEMMEMGRLEGWMGGNDGWIHGLQTTKRNQSVLIKSYDTGRWAADFLFVFCV
jgi:hypothetical protein